MTDKEKELEAEIARLKTRVQVLESMVKAMESMESQYIDIIKSLQSHLSVLRRELNLE